MIPNFGSLDEYFKSIHNKRISILFGTKNYSKYFSSVWESCSCWAVRAKKTSSRQFLRYGCLRVKFIIISSVAWFLTVWEQSPFCIVFDRIMNKIDKVSFKSQNYFLFYTSREWNYFWRTFLSLEVSVTLHLLT